MSVTKPITELETVKELMSVYKEGTKNHLILAYALNTGLRVSDIIKAEVGDSRRGYWIGNEQKTGKAKELRLPDSLQQLVINYVEAEQLEDNAPLFHQHRDKTTAVSRQAIDKVVRHAGDQIGIRLSAHSLRKTFGYQAYNSKQYDLAELQQIFNHSSSQVTLRYIGVTDELINEKQRGFSLGI